MSPKFQYDGEDNRPDYIPAGVYTATVIDAKEGQSQAGNEKIRLTWQTDSPKWKVWDTLVFTKNSKWKIDTFLVAVGMAPAKGKEIDITPEGLIGARAFVQVVVDPPDDNGKVWNSIAKYITDRGVPEQPKVEVEEDKLPMGKEEKKADKDIDNLPF